MSNRYAGALAAGKLPVACVCPTSGKGFHPIAAVIAAARALWPSKTALELAARTGASERTAKYWLARRCNLSAEHLAELICSDAGLDVLEAIMERRKTKPDWWRAFKRRVRMEDLARRQAEMRRELEAIEQERAGELAR